MRAPGFSNSREIFAATCLALTSMAATFATAEIWARHWPVQEEDYGHRPWAPLSPPLQLNPSLEKKISQYPFARNSPNPKLEVAASQEGVEYSDNNLPPMGTTYRLVARTRRSHQTIYDISITTDKFGRRLNSSPRKKEGEPVLLLGDSYVFGEGLNAHFTLPHFLQLRLPQNYVMNLGRSGAAQNDFLHWLQTADPIMADGVPQGGTAAFVYLGFHWQRIACPISAYFRQNKYILKKPAFYLRSDGTLAKGISCGDRPIRDFIYRALSRSAFLQRIHFRWPAPDPTLITRTMAAIKNELIQQRGLKRFIVLIYPHQFGDELGVSASSFEREGLEVLDLSHLDLGKLTENDFAISGDGHPSARAHWVLAEILADYLSQPLQTTHSPPYSDGKTQL